jgi:pilus assembly protein CpaC
MSDTTSGKDARRRLTNARMLMMLTKSPRRRALLAIVFSLALAGTLPSTAAWAQDSNPAPIVQKITASGERLKMIVNTSRILELDQNVPRVVVNNPDVLEITPLGAKQVQIFAKKPGVTQVNIWVQAETAEAEAQEEIRTVDVVVVGDAQELTMLLHSQFPNSSIEVTPTASSVIVSGFVDNPSHVERIIEIAQDYHPKVINNLNVGGGQQVLLHIRLMEVSRTKLRDLGIDWGFFNGGDFVQTGVSGLINASTINPGTVNTTGGAQMAFGVVDASSQFFGVLAALRENNMLKILANPTLVTVSGRPAFFNVGGEFPILVPQSLGTVSIQYKKFGTQVDFVPIVMGNANLRLEVRPRVSEIDPTRSVTVNSISVPALRVREVDTGVEMQAGQTLALAGLVQVRQDERTRAIPVLGELPFVGAAFRRVRTEENEIELLILVTPQLAESMDCEEVPPCGPGTMTDVPRDCDLYLKGRPEVPAYRPGPLDQPDCMNGQCNPGCQLPGPIDMEGPHRGVPTPVEEVPAGAPTARKPAPRTKTVQTSSRAQRPKTSTESRPAPGLIGPAGYDHQ